VELMYEFAETIDLCGKPNRVYIDRKQVFENAFFVRKAPWYEQLWFKLRFNSKERPIHTISSGGTIQYTMFMNVWWFYEPRLWYQWFNRVRCSLGKVKKQ